MLPKILFSDLSGARADLLRTQGTLVKGGTLEEEPENRSEQPSKLPKRPGTKKGGEGGEGQDAGQEKLDRRREEGVISGTELTALKGRVRVKNEKAGRTGIIDMIPMLAKKFSGRSNPPNPPEADAAPQNPGNVSSSPETEILTIQVPPRRISPSLPSITPGRSLTSSVLGRGPTRNVRELFKFGKLLGEGQFGKVYICKEIATGNVYACKSVSRSTLISEEDVEDVRKEVSILTHLAGQPHIVRLKGTYEDRQCVHMVMELCLGGELFDQINARVSKDHAPYREKDASKLAKAVITAVERCHSMGVIHRDLKPENFLLTSKKDDSVLKAADFGLATFFSPGQTFSRVCGSAMYMAPEVIKLWQGKRGVNYGPEVDIWSAGVIIHILLTGSHPFPAPSNERTDAGFMRAILKGNLTFWSADWRGISKDAKDLVKWMLQYDPKNRPTAKQVLEHPWIVNAPDSPLERDVILRFSRFLVLLRMKNLRKVLMRAIASKTNEEELSSLSQLLESCDLQKQGHVSLGVFCRCLQDLSLDHPLQELKRMMELTELEENENLEYKEFLTATFQLCRIEKQENLFEAFSLFDQDLSGFITSAELKRACAQFKVDEETMEEMLKEVNRDENGRIDYNEFVAMMRRESGGLGRKSVEGILDGLSMKDMVEAV